MSPLMLSVGLGLVAALANSVGGLIVLRRRWERHSLKYFVSLGSGFMLGTALLEMVPESLRLWPARGPFLILVGYCLVHFFEHTLTAHFHFGEEIHGEQFLHSHKSYTVMLALLVHTLFDGIAIASGFLVSRSLGMLIFLAIFLHKIPEGFTVGSVMLASGKSRATAFSAAMGLGAATLLGALAMNALHSLVAVGLPLSAGVTIYVAASDLVPEVNREPGLIPAMAFFAGVLAVFGLEQWLGT